MATTKKPSFSFAGGIIGPELYGRLDLVKHQTGLAEALNFWILPHGPVQNRPGFEYVLEVKDSTKAVRLIPFSFNTEQTFVIEVGDEYVRFHTQGATLLETGLAITAISKANPGVVTYTGSDPSVGDWMYLSGVGGMTELNGRFVKIASVNAGANTFQITDIHGGANINTTGFTTYTSGGTAARVYEIATPYQEADLFDLHFVQSADVLTIVHPSYAPRELRRLSATNWELTEIAFEPVIATPAAPNATAGGGSAGTPQSYTYKVTAVADETGEESLASPSDSASQDLTVTGQYIDIDPATVTGAVRYNFYKLSNGLYGYIGQTDGTAFRDNNVTADTSQAPPEAQNPFDGADDYPGAVGYYEQRRAFGGTNNKPQNFWATKSATESNLSYSIPSRDDDRIAFRIASREVNRIRHIVDLNGLILLTSGGETQVRPQNSDVLTFESAAPKSISTEGASNVQPAVTSSSIIFVQESGSTLRELKPNQYDSRAFDAPKDISIMAPHLFEGYTIDDLTYAKTPNKMIWCARSDGQLLGLTYLPEHDVLAWHHHDTLGSFESVCCVKEGSEYALYVVVLREINEREVRYIERMHTRRISSIEDSFFVDAGFTYDGSATTTIRHGLWHLEGQDVTVLADGAEVTGLTVENGAITLENEASVVHVGLGITADVQTLPVALQAEAFGQGLMVNVNAAYLRLKDTSGIRVGPSFDDEDLQEITMRSTENYGTPPALMNGVYEVTLTPEWKEDAQVCIRQSAPLPCTILALTLEVAVGG